MRSAIALDKRYKTVHDKTYNKTCATSKDSDQPVHLPGMARIFVYPSLDSPKAVGHQQSAKTLMRLRGCTG